MHMIIYLKCLYVADGNTINNDLDIKQEVVAILTNLVDSVVTCKKNRVFLIVIYCCLSVKKHVALSLE